MAKLFDKLKKGQNPAEDEGLDILTDEIKEPFSMRSFFETHIVERAKRIKSLLAEKGILFFLFSPFQTRNRLIAQLCILCIGVLFGVVPRASNLVNELQDQAYQSEIAGLSPKTVGDITITPAASSNYQKLHMLGFVIEGKNLPSDASKYEVHLSRAYGASDWANVTYSWNIYPVTDSKRILLVSIDQSKQASGYGAFSLYVQLAGEEVSNYAKTPFEITLSTAQDTTDLYDKTGVHLSAMTEAVCGTGSIEKKQEEFDEAIKAYQVVLEQAEAMPIDISVSPTMDELESFCLANRMYRTLNDHSTTEDIVNMEEMSLKKDISYDVVITSEGIQYDSEFVEQLKEAGGYSDEDAIIFSTFESVNDAKEDVTSAMDNVNNAAVSWYSTLTSYKLILNQTVRTDSFPFSAKCTNTIEEEISFIDKNTTDTEPSDNESMTQPELSGTMTGDDEYTKPVPSDDGISDESDTITDEPEIFSQPSSVSEPEVSEKPVEEQSDVQQPETTIQESEPVSETAKTQNSNPPDNGGSVTTSASVSADPADSK